MADIRSREKVKDVRTIDRLQAATHHVKEGYVRAKEQAEDTGPGQEASPSEYAGNRMETELKRGMESAARAGADKSRGTAAYVKRKAEEIRERQGEKADDSTDVPEEGGVQEASSTDTGSGDGGAAKERAGIEKTIKEAGIKKEEVRQGRAAGAEEPSKRNNQAEKQAENREIKGKEMASQAAGEAGLTEQDGGAGKPFAGQNVREKMERLDGRPPGRREGRSPALPETASGKEIWIRTKEHTGRDIKEPAHATGSWSRPSMKGAWAQNGRTVKTGVSNAAFAPSWSLPEHANIRQHRWAVQSYRTAAQRGQRAVGKSAAAITKGIAAKARQATVAAKIAAWGGKALNGLVLSTGGIAVLIILFVALFGGIFLTSMGSNPQGGGENVSQEVIAYTPAITQYARQYGIPQFVMAIQAMMMQESGGQGTDPMQSSECPYNTRFPNSPGAITEPEYSIQVGIQYFASCLQEAGCESPMDMDKLSLAWQGYNYGNGYITWAIQNFGGYSEANALVFSQQQAASHGWPGYGDPQYVPHVLRYYQFSSFPMGDSSLVEVARSQVGNRGGQPYWSWYGFPSREPWCACFVSWCADQCGYLEAGLLPRFSACEEGIGWFMERGLYHTGGYMPKPGDLIFFDWEGDGVSDHVGIVESVEAGAIHTIEGNSSDTCALRSYSQDDGRICGYGEILIQ